MWAWLKVVGLVLLAIAPGGLVVLLAFLLARTVAESMRLDEGPSGRRLARAVARVRFRDVWAQARRAF
ncbi:MAG: hypothetical protein IT380_05485 [Myxococcales bacterium]|nr:hypothetical protein [Myxococcales bacterium]